MANDRQRRLRHILRGPLHQLISYTEIAVECCPPRSLGSLVTLKKLSAQVEAALAVPDMVVQPDFDLSSEKFAALRERFVLSANAIRASIVELRTEPEEVEDDLWLKSTAKLEKVFDELQGMLDALQPNHLEGLLAQIEKSPVAFKSQTGPSTEPPLRGVALVVDDNEGNRELLSRRLLKSGCDVLLAENGRQALRMIRRYQIDVVLLDIMMPETDGYQVLAEMKRDPALRNLPVIMISAVDDLESVVHCIEMGADDYLFKPFNAVLLRARVHGLLERKRLTDEDKAQKKMLEQAYSEIDRQRKKAESLLLNILPQAVAEQLQTLGFVEPIYYQDTTIVFADFAGFTLKSESLSADELVDKLNRYFSVFDTISQKYGVEKLKTIGDCYMFAGGLPSPSRSHPVVSILAAMEMQSEALRLDDSPETSLPLRIGVHTGPVIAGVVGLHKFAFDVWGDTVNLASRVEACGEPGRINISASTYARVKDFFLCERRGRVRIKDGRELEMFFINGLSPSLGKDANLRPQEAFQKRYRTYFQEKLRTLPPGLEFRLDTAIR